MPLKLVTAPAEEPVSLDDALVHLRLEDEDDAGQLGYISALITAARRWCESYQNRAYIIQTWDLVLDCFPENAIRVPLPPLQSVVYIKYKDPSGSEQTLDPAEYAVDAACEPGRVVPAYGCSWPDTRDEIGTVTVRFTAGYGAPAAVPAEIRHAILIKLADLYQNRGDEEGGDKGARSAVEALLAPDRIMPI
jgi:uncharacterized phiE125 gp8 family phage protein